MTSGLPLYPQEEAFATRSPGHSRLGVFLLFFFRSSPFPTPYSFFISEHSGGETTGREGRCSPHACRVRKPGSEGALGGPVSALVSELELQAGNAPPGWERTHLNLPEGFCQRNSVRADSVLSSRMADSAFLLV